MRNEGMKQAASVIEELLFLGERALDRLIKARPYIDGHLRARLGDIAGRLGLVEREEFDAALAMIAKARARQEEILDRLSAIEKKLKMSSASKVITSKKKYLRSVKQGNRQRRAKA